MEAGRDDVVRIGELELRFHVTEPNATVFDFVVPSRARVPVPHSHREADEILHGIEGILTVMVDGATRELRPGEVVFIPRGSVHHHQNLHEGVSRSLVVITPGTIGREYFEEIAGIVNGPGKPDPVKVVEVMMRHGLVPA